MLQAEVDQLISQATACHGCMSIDIRDVLSLELKFNTVALSRFKQAYIKATKIYVAFSLMPFVTLTHMLEKM